MLFRSDQKRLNTVLHSMALFRVERNEMRIGHRFVDGVANRACRTGMVWWRRCALVAPCVGPVLTEPVSGAVPSHFAGVLVVVAEDSRLIAFWASAHCYESNPYNGDTLCGNSPTNLAVGVDTLSIIPSRSSAHSTAISSSFAIFVRAGTQLAWGQLFFQWSIVIRFLARWCKCRDFPSFPRLRHVVNFLIRFLIPDIHM